MKREQFMKEMTLEQAKAKLLDMAVGSNDYEHIESWEELAEGAAQEEVSARDRTRHLAELLAYASEQAELEELKKAIK